jgi:vacuolar-type H+-ATPase subunit E/Vma4
MPAPAQNSADVLCAEILAAARRESDEILQHARAEMEAVLAAANAEAEKARTDQHSAARTEAARRREMILATVAVESGRLRSGRVEALLESIHEEIRHRLQASDFDVHETAIALAAEAIRQMPGTDFVVKLSVAGHASSGGSLADEIARRVGRSPLNLTISADPSITGGGVIVEDADGLRIWDNRLMSRLERLWPELRRQIARQTALAGEHGSGTGVPPVSSRSQTPAPILKHTGETPVPPPKP